MYMEVFVVMRTMRLERPTGRPAAAAIDPRTAIIRDSR